MHRAEEHPEFLFLFVRMLGVLMCYMFFLQNKRIFHLQKMIGNFITLWMESGMEGCAVDFSGFPFLLELRSSSCQVTCAGDECETMSNNVQ